ncbi:MAG: DUF3830 family protein [Bacillota bacterium]|nr:DUF3830 family protein [Bacillota bacterium]
MPLIKITIGQHVLKARLEEHNAPKTCKAFLKHLPLSSRLIQARWSGEAAWIPMGSVDFGVGHENPTSYPAPGQILLYPGGLSETEILLPYGATAFASKVGMLAGNHFLTVVEGQEVLESIGKTVLWEGAQDIKFEVAAP